MVGTVKQYPDEGAVRRAVVGLVSEINADARPLLNSVITSSKANFKGKHLAQSRDKENLQSVLDPLDLPSLAEIRVV